MDYPFNQLSILPKQGEVLEWYYKSGYDMANRGLKYSSVSGKRYIHKLAEMHSYYLHSIFTISKRTWCL